MVSGNKDRFALEYEIREYYESDFIGDGKFLVHIGGISFGQDRIDSTTFSAIIPCLGQRTKKYVVSDEQFHTISEEKLARRFYETGYSDTKSEDLDADQVAVFRRTIGRDHIEWSSMDEAFDDGSFVLQVNLPCEEVILVGFRTALYQPGVIEVIKSIRIGFSEFREVILGFIESIKSDFEKEFGHGGELPVFNWWKGDAV